MPGLEQSLLVYPSWPDARRFHRVRNHTWRLVLSSARCSNPTCLGSIVFFYFWNRDGNSAPAHSPELPLEPTPHIGEAPASIMAASSTGFPAAQSEPVLTMLPNADFQQYPTIVSQPVMMTALPPSPPFPVTERSLSPGAAESYLFGLLCTADAGVPCMFSRSGRHAS